MDSRMSVEIEKKYRLDPERRKGLEDALRAAGGQFIQREFEENTIFRNDDLAGQGAIIRVRKTDSRVLLTFKRRVASAADVKHQIEHEVEVSDAEIVRSILEELGLKPRLVYEKYRDTWEFRSVEIVIDELPFGLYMEIEGAITGIREAEMLLEIEDLETEHETYPRLTAQCGKRNGDAIEARFETTSPPDSQ
jgi:adenylate cyclase class 2